MDDYVIHYGSDTAKALSGIKELERANKIMAQKLGIHFTRATQLISSNIKKVGTSITRVGSEKKGFKNITRDIMQATTVIKTAKNRFKELTEIIINQDGQFKRGTATLKDVTKQYTKTTKTTKNASKATKTFGQNLAFLAKRAVLVIPTWLVLRSAITSVINVFKDGIKHIAEFDARLQKAKRSMVGSAEEITAQFNLLKKEAIGLSLKTGVAVEDIATAFQRFITTGQSFEVSMAGAEASTKLALVQFGDTVEVANSLARAYNVLGHTINKNIKEQDRMLYIASLQDELWKDNAFDVNEMDKAWTKMLPTSQALNISMEDTIRFLAVLHSGAVIGGRAGQLFGSAMIKLFSDLDNVAQVLKIKVNPELDNSVDVIFKVIDALENLKSFGELEGVIATSGALRDLFNLRGQIPISALVSVRKKLDKAFATTPNIDALNKAVNDVSETTKPLIERFHTANKEIGKAFLTGLISGEDFNKTLLKIVETQEKMIENSEEFIKKAGIGIRGFFDKGFAIRELLSIPAKIRLDEEEFKTTIEQALDGSLNQIDLTKVYNELIKRQTEGLKTPLNPEELENVIIQLRTQLLEKTIKQKNLILDIAIAINKQSHEQSKNENKEKKFILNKKELLKQEQQVRKELKAFGLSELEIEEKLLVINKASGIFLEKELSLQNDLIASLKRIETIELARTRATGLIDNQIELLRLQGATNVQLLKAERTLETMYGINQDRHSQLRHEIELEQELTKEKIRQTDLSNETIKLYKIAQKFGRGRAKDVFNFLRGDISLTGDLFSEIEPILEEFFQSQLIQAKATQYFFKGRGKSLPIVEREAIKDFQPLPIDALKLPDISTNISNINIQIKKLFSTAELSTQIVQEIVNAIQTNPTIKEEIDNRIENY